MKRYLPFVIVAVVAVATIGSGAMLYRAKRPHVLSIPEDKTLSAKSGPESPHIRGNPDAPVTLEEYGDFQCPPCGMFAAFLGQLEKEYESRLRVVFRNFPLAMHQHAREAALAAEAMDGEQARARVEADHQRGESLGINITPTLFINNQPLDPKDKNPEGIRAEINAALEKKSQT